MKLWWWYEANFDVEKSQQDLKAVWWVKCCDYWMSHTSGSRGLAILHCGWAFANCQALRFENCGTLCQLTSSWLQYEASSGKKRVLLSLRRDRRWCKERKLMEQSCGELGQEMMQSDISEQRAKKRGETDLFQECKLWWGLFSFNPSTIKTYID